MRTRHGPGPLRRLLASILVTGILLGVLSPAASAASLPQDTGGTTIAVGTDMDPSPAQETSDSATEEEDGSLQEDSTDDSNSPEEATPLEDGSTDESNLPEDDTPPSDNGQADDLAGLTEEDPVISEVPIATEESEQEVEPSQWDKTVDEFLSLGNETDMELVGIAQDPDAISANSAIALFSNSIWAFYVSHKYHDDPNNSNNYLRYDHGNYGVNIHKAYNSSEDKEYWAYCLNLQKGSTTSKDYDYTMTSLPSDPEYQIARYVLGMGYGSQNHSQLAKLFGYTLNTTEALQGTQIAIWASQSVRKGVYSSLSQAFSTYYSLNPKHADSDALNYAKALATAAAHHYDEGWALSIGTAALSSESISHVIYRIPITAKYLYGGYSATVSGLPSGSTMTCTSDNIQISGSSVTSTTVTGTEYLYLKIPRSAAQQNLTIRISAQSYLATYTNNNAVLFAKSDNSSRQNFAIVGRGGLTQKLASVTMKITIPRLPSGQATVSKLDANTNEPVPGVVFALYQYDGTDFADTGRRASTNASGVATFTGLQYSVTNQGLYRIYEVSSSTHTVYTNRYVALFSLSTGTWYAYTSATASQTTGTVSPSSSGSYDFSFSFTAYNEPKTGSITVMKRDVETGDPLAGATFTLQEWQASTAWDGSHGAYVSTGRTATTDSSGQAVFSDLTVTSENCGKFRVVETGAPDGYELDSSFYAACGIGSGWYRYQSSLVEDTTGTLSGDATIHAAMNSMEYPILSAASSNTGFHFTMYMYDQPTSVPHWFSLRVQKIAVTHDGTSVNLSGATFGLYKLDESNTWMRLAELKENVFEPGTYVLPTEENGTPIVELKPDVTYKVVEELAPDGVINIGWEEQFTVQEDNLDQELSFTCEDKLPTGTIVLRKTDQETGLPLAGVEFTVTAKEDIAYTLGDNRYTVYQAGDEIGVITTAEDGTASLDGLYYGTYEITETAGLPDYKLLEDSFTAVVGAPEGYQESTVYSDAGIAQVTYDGVATVYGYEEYHQAEYGKYLKDENGVVLRYDLVGDTYVQADDGAYAQVAYASVTNQAIHPDMAVAKLADRTTNPNGGAVAFDDNAGRYTEEKIPGTYYNGQTVTFTLTSTNTGDVTLYNPYLIDIFSEEIWTVVESSNPDSTEPGTRTTDVTFRDGDGNELTTGSTLTTTAGDTVTVQAVHYNDVTHTYQIDWDHLNVDDSVILYLTFTLYNYDNINKVGLPNDVYLYAQYLSHGDTGALTDVPGGGEDDYDCHDDDAINVVSVGSITIEKKDGAGNEMEGAIFQLSDQDGQPVTWALLEDGSYSATVIAENGDWIPASEATGYETTTQIVTDTAGTAELVNLPVGSYQLMEVQTTSGHLLLDSPVDITLPYVVEGEEDTETPDAVYIVGAHGIGRNYYYHLTYEITNTSVFRLPSTGGHASWLIAAGTCISGLTLAAAAGWNRRRNKLKV